MALINFSADLTRTADALERIASALERIAGPEVQPEEPPQHPHRTEPQQVGRVRSARELEVEKIGKRLRGLV